MKLNDSNGTTKLTDTMKLKAHRDEIRNSTAMASVGICTRRRIAAAAAAAAAAVADADNNNDDCYSKNVVSPTQGDTLNQIKALRRRTMRIPTNITPASSV